MLSALELVLLWLVDLIVYQSCIPIMLIYYWKILCYCWNPAGLIPQYSFMVSLNHAWTGKPYISEWIGSFTSALSLLSVFLGSEVNERRHLVAASPSIFFSHAGYCGESRGPPVETRFAAERPVAPPDEASDRRAEPLPEVELGVGIETPCPIRYNNINYTRVW